MHITRGKQAFLAVFHFVTINAYLISAMSQCHTNMLLCSPLAACLDAATDQHYFVICVGMAPASVFKMLFDRVVPNHIPGVPPTSHVFRVSLIKHT